MLHADVFIQIVFVLVDVEGRGLGRIEHFNIARHHINRACGQIVIFGACRTVAHQSCHLQHIFAARFAGVVVGGRGIGDIDDDLGDAPTVTEINKNQPALIAAAVDPSGQSDGVSGVFGAQFAAGMRLQHTVLALFIKSKV